MESFRFIFTFLLVFLSSSTIVCVFGFEREASALLQFKQSSVFVDVNGSLNSWTNTTALCSWAGVICSQPGAQVHGLNLSNMGLVGRLDLSPLMSIANFTDLNLHGNYFYGNLSSTSPTCSFKRVDISSNNFFESIANDFFVHCHHLLSLNLSTNSISGGLFSFPPSLQELDLSSNNFSGLLPLKALTHCTSLRVIDLSSNNLSGQLTTEFGFCKHLPSLSKLILADNFISGGIPSEISDCINLSTIDFSFNDLTGPIPSKIWSLKKLVNLAMSANNLSGEIHEDLCTKSASIETLILDHNNLSGVLPASITMCKNLTWVSISNNKLSGQIPMNIGNLKNLAILQLSNNMIIGEVPEDLGNCKSLIWLDLGQNKLSGSIPSSLAAQSGLIVPETLSNLHLVFVHNYADGIKCPGPLLFIHSKRIPKRLANFLLLSSCQSQAMGIYTDTTLYPFETNGSMIYVDLSYNSLTGSIPEEFGKMDYLRALNLDGNMLTGIIPDSFGRLKMIGVLHLSRNQLTGDIPGVLGALSFLTDFDVSNNNLTGVIPTAGQLLTFGPARYANNSGLCGVPLGPCGSGGSGIPWGSYGSGESDEEKPETTGADNSVSKGDILIMFVTFVSGFITAISIASIVQGVISTCFKGGKNERRAQSRQRRP